LNTTIAPRYRAFMSTRYAALLVPLVACAAVSRADDAAIVETAIPDRYASEGSLALNLSTAWATDFADGNYWMPFAIGVSWFAAEGFSLDLAAEMYTVRADEPDVTPANRYDATGGGGSIGLSWHFWRGEIAGRDATVFVDAGVGLLWTGSDLPPQGARLNFTPRAGVGATLALDPTTRLVAALRWFHISNAQTASENPGIDALQVSVGVSFAF